MIFSGLPVWLVSITAIVAAGVLIASHFLKMRQKTVLVPTVYFWRQAVESTQRNILLGRFSSVLTFIFLLVIVLLITLTMLSPVLSPLDTQILIIDTCPSTDLSFAKKYARALIEKSDRSILLSVGKDVMVHTNINDSRQTALAALGNISESQSAFSGLFQAIEEAKSVKQSKRIVVLSGQQPSDAYGIEHILCSSSNDVCTEKPLKISFPEEFRLQAKAYCSADHRFEYCKEKKHADVVIDSLDDFNLRKWNQPEFLELFSAKIEQQAGLKYRQTVTDIETNKPGRILSTAYQINFRKGLSLAVFVMLVLEINLVNKRKLI